MDRAPSERGQAAAEYLGALTLVAAVLAAVLLAAPGLGDQLAGGIQRAICTIVGNGCESGDDAATAAVDLQALVTELPDLPPAERHDRLEQLSGAQRRELAGLAPELLGGLDGAPAELRYEANQLRLEQHVAGLEAEAASIEAELARLAPQVNRGPAPSTPPPAGLQAALESRHRALLGRQADVEAELRRYRGWLERDRQLLLFDPAGDGRVIEVFGDLERSEHVAVVVPGMSNDIGNFDGQLRSNAMRLQAAASRYDPDVATIAWLGYDTPEGLSAAAGGPATDGSRSLSPFGEGLEADRDRHLTVIGHSYGSLVTGVALRQQGLDLEDAVFVGSPGVGVDDRDDLGTGFDVWAAKAPGDPVSYAPVHGEDPSAAGFGAIRFHTGSNGPLSQRHSSYFLPGSESLENMALIATDHDDQVTRL